VLNDDGKDGDALAGDRVFSGRFGPLKTDGVYSVLFRATGLTYDGEPFIREFRRGIHVAVGVSAGNTPVTLAPIDARRSRLVLTPRDANGLLLGPGFASSLSASAGSGTLGAVQDLGDGRYSIDLALPAGADGPVIDVRFGDEPLKTVLVQPAATVDLWRWIIILALIVLLYLLWRRSMTS
jgi:hypothetical protein